MWLSSNKDFPKHLESDCFFLYCTCFWTVLEQLCLDCNMSWICHIVAYFDICPLTSVSSLFSVQENFMLESDCLTLSHLRQIPQWSLSRCSTLNCEVVVELLCHKLQDPSQTTQMVWLFCDRSLLTWKVSDLNMLLLWAHPQLLYVTVHSGSCLKK